MDKYQRIVNKVKKIQERRRENLDESYDSSMDTGVPRGRRGQARPSIMEPENKNVDDLDVRPVSQLDDPGTFARMNMYVKKANCVTGDPWRIIRNIHYKLHIVGINFKLPIEADLPYEPTTYVFDLMQHGGQYGPTPEGEWLNDSGFNGDFALVVEVDPTDDGMWELDVSIQRGEDLELDDDDEEFEDEDDISYMTYDQAESGDYVNEGFLGTLSDKDVNKFVKEFEYASTDQYETKEFLETLKGKRTFKFLFEPNTNIFESKKWTKLLSKMFDESLATDMIVQLQHSEHIHRSVRDQLLKEFPTNVPISQLRKKIKGYFSESFNEGCGCTHGDPDHTLEERVSSEFTSDTTEILFDIIDSDNDLMSYIDKVNDHLISKVRKNRYDRRKSITMFKKALYKISNIIEKSPDEYIMDIEAKDLPRGLGFNMKDLSARNFLELASYYADMFEDMVDKGNYGQGFKDYFTTYRG